MPPEDGTDLVLAGAHRRRRLVLALLLVLVVTLGLVNVQPDAWPVVTWPVYAKARPGVPGPTTSVIEARVRTGSGRTHVLRGEDLVEFSRLDIADEALEGSIDDVEDRAYLTRLVRGSLDDGVEFIELWVVTWRVDPQAVPPLQRDRPITERKLVRFRPDDGVAGR